MITLFCVMLAICLLFSLAYLGLWVLGIVLFIIGCCNLWKSKNLEPYDFFDDDHMKRTEQRTKNKAIIQMVVGFILFAIFLA